MSARQTGTVPKTKHNSRPRRENPANHMPNNLDWHDPYQSQRARKESNTSASRLSDTGDDIVYVADHPWLALGSSQRADEEELRWPNVKSSNLTPERSGSTLSNVESVMSSPRQQLFHRSEPSGQEERPPASNSREERNFMKQKMDESQRKIMELKQQQALLNIRNKGVQQVQVKPVRVDHVPTTRSKGIAVKPMQQMSSFDQMANIESRIQNVQDYTQLIQSLAPDDGISAPDMGAGDSNPLHQMSEQQIRNKLNELIAKKAQVDNVLAYLESEALVDPPTNGPAALPDAPASISSDEGEGNASALYPRQLAGESDEMALRDGTGPKDKQTSEIQAKELKLEFIKSNLEQLHALLSRVENWREFKFPSRAGADGSFDSTGQHKNTATRGTSKGKRFPTSYSVRNRHKPSHSSPSLDFPAMQENIIWNGEADQNHPGYYSSDEVDPEYDDSPVKLGSLAQSYTPHNNCRNPRGSAETVGTNTSPNAKYLRVFSARRRAGRESAERENGLANLGFPEQGPPEGLVPSNPESVINPNNATLAVQISQLQLQIDQLQLLYQNISEKQQHVPSLPAWLQPQNMGYMQFMNPHNQWHQHQLLIGSLNQCCQLIWHQQRELAGLRQALNMVQEEGAVGGYKYNGTEEEGGYGPNLVNFEQYGPVWGPQPPLNNQVPPGNRANNYWDNFRSYSRQNLLSGRNKSNEGSITDSLQPHPPTSHNLRRKENSTNNVHLRQHVENGIRVAAESRDQNGGPRSWRRRFFNSNIKPEDEEVNSLERSVYSEIETILGDTDRSPEMLLQLLSQLKLAKSQQQSPFEDPHSGFDEQLLNSAPEDLDNPPRRSGMPLTNDDIKDERFLIAKVARLLQDGPEFCIPEFLEVIVNCVIRFLRLPSHHDTVARLEVGLVKFQGARLDQVRQDLLCVVSNTAAPHFAPPLSNGVDGRDLGIEDEEGAVGGAPAPQLQRSTPQSMETELAEADQTQHNSMDNVQAFEPDEVPDDIKVEGDIDVPLREDSSTEQANHEL